MFVHNNFGGRLGAIELTEVERELLVMVNRELKAYINNLEHIKCVVLMSRSLSFTPNYPCSRRGMRG